MIINISSSELQKFPDVLSRLVPTMDITPLKKLLVGLVFPSTGNITFAVALSPTDTLTLQIISSPN